MEPHASIAVWDGGDLTLYGSYQMLNYNVNELADALDIDADACAYRVALCRRRVRVEAGDQPGGDRGRRRRARLGRPVSV